MTTPADMPQQRGRTNGRPHNPHLAHTGTADSAPRFRTAVVGCGAAAFGLHLPVLTTHPGFDVVAVADRDPARARHAADAFGIDRTARDGATLLGDADVLVVLTGVHDTLIAQAIAAGRHVVTEKPVSLDLERTRELRDRAHAAGVMLEVGAMRAHDPALHALLAAVPAPTGGWLVKADGVDEAARRRVLPHGFAPYTFAGDPPQPTPADLGPQQLAALQVLLWQGYHLLTALVLAAPAARAHTCVLDDRGTLHATVTSGDGHAFTLVVAPAPPGCFHEQIHLADPRHAATLNFAPPYRAPAATTVTVHTAPAGTESGFRDPFAALWTAVHQRLAGQHPADLPTGIDLAVRVEELAADLARHGRRTRRRRKPPGPSAAALAAACLCRGR
ncbi:Gfo/Idh/MocA family oxidoreductase [Streptomycetaceae bacterium NBC_01309]